MHLGIIALGTTDPLYTRTFLHYTIQTRKNNRRFALEVFRCPHSNIATLLLALAPAAAVPLLATLPRGRQLSFSGFAYIITSTGDQHEHLNS